MDCEQALERMSEALDGPLSPQAREELDDHLARCPHCAALFEALKGQSQVLRELDPPFPEGLHQKVLDNLPPQRPAVPTARSSIPNRPRAGRTSWATSLRSPPSCPVRMPWPSCPCWRSKASLIP